jgi:hypothetical protein
MSSRYTAKDLDKQRVKEARSRMVKTRMRNFTHAFTIIILGEIFHIHLYHGLYSLLRRQWYSSVSFISFNV